MPGLKRVLSRIGSKATKLTDADETYFPIFLEKAKNSRLDLLKAIILIDRLNIYLEYPERAVAVDALLQHWGKKKNNENRKNALAELKCIYIRILEFVPEKQHVEFYSALRILVEEINKINIANKAIKDSSFDIKKVLEDLQQTLDESCGRELLIVNQSLSSYQQKRRVSILQDNIKTLVDDLKMKTAKALQNDEDGLFYKTLWQPLFEKLKKDKGIGFYWFKRTLRHLGGYPANPAELKEFITTTITTTSREIIYKENYSPGSCAGDMPEIECYEEIILSWTLENKYDDNSLQTIIDEFESQYEALQINEQLIRLHSLHQWLDKSTSYLVQENCEKNLLEIKARLIKIKTNFELTPNVNKQALIGVASRLQQVSKTWLTLPMDIESLIISFIADPKKKTSQFGPQGKVTPPSNVSPQDFALQEIYANSLITFFRALSGKQSLDKAKQLDAWELKTVSTNVIK